MAAKARVGEHSVAELAARQHGVVARRQLLSLGYGRNRVQDGAATGRLHRIHRGVYAVGHARLSQRGRWMAAVLACGPGALLSHRSAAALWNILPSTGSLPDVTVAGSRAPRRGLRIHGAGRLTYDDRAIRDGIPLTSPARTVIDLAALLDRARLERVIEESERLGLFDLRAVDEVLSRYPRCRGRVTLRAALSAYHEPTLSRSDFESAFLRMLRDAHLPLPSVNAHVAGYEVDFSGERNGSSSSSTATSSTARGQPTSATGVVTRTWLSAAIRYSASPGFASTASRRRSSLECTATSSVGGASSDPGDRRRR